MLTTTQRIDFYNNFKKFVKDVAESFEKMDDEDVVSNELDHSSWEKCAFGLFINKQLSGCYGTGLQEFLYKYGEHINTRSEKIAVGVMLLKCCAPKDLVDDLTEDFEETPSIKTWQSLSKRLNG